MPSSRGCRSSYDCVVKIKGVTTRPILFSQLMRSDGEGAMNPEELFADDRSPASEQQRVHEDELHSLMRSILDWAISFLSESSQGTIRAIYFEGKTVKQHSEEEYVTVYAIWICDKAAREDADEFLHSLGCVDEYLVKLEVLTGEEFRNLKPLFSNSKGQIRVTNKNAHLLWILLAPLDVALLRQHRDIYACAEGVF